MKLNGAYLSASIATLAVALAAAASAQTIKPEVPEVPQCGSVVIIKCDKPVLSPEERERQETIRRREARRAQRGVIEFDRVIVEGEATVPGSPEDVISRALYRPLIRSGDNTFSIGESAQCTCLNLCPPPPLPCCQCTDRVGSRLGASPGWAPTR